MQHANPRDGAVQRYAFAVVTWVLLVGLVLVVVHLVRNPALLPPGPVAARAGRAAGPAAANLVTNAGFERGTTGWGPLGRARLGRAAGGHASDSAALLRAAGTGPAVAGMQFACAAHGAAGSRWVATAWVRSEQAGIELELSVVAGSGGARPGRARTAAGGRWQRLSVTSTLPAAATTVRVRLQAPKLGTGQAVVVDDVALRRA